MSMNVQICYHRCAKGLLSLVLNRVENLPFCRDLLIILVKVGDIMNVSSFNIFAGMLSLLLSKLAYLRRCDEISVCSLFTFTFVRLWEPFHIGTPPVHKALTPQVDHTTVVSFLMYPCDWLDELIWYIC